MVKRHPSSSLSNRMITTTVLVSITILVTFTMLPVIYVNAQFAFGGNNAGTSTDPVPLLLQSASGIRQCYSFNGQLNNIQNPNWGSVGEPLLRPEGSSYKDDDWSQFRTGPNPREISNLLAHETCSDGSRNGEPCMNDWTWLGTQWIDHDLTMVPTFGRSNTTNDLSVQAPPSDPFISDRKLPLSRSLTNENSSLPNEQINLATSWLDQSQLYGSTIDKADGIRTFRNGMLKSTTDGFMPVLSSRLNLDMTGVPTFQELGAPSNKDQFLCADMRCNQHAPMASFQTLWVREHNRIALALSQANHPAYNNDEAIYQAARAAVIAMNQAITYNELLPIILGKFDLPAYSGYKPDQRPTVSNAFSTAGFRTFHSMVGCEFKEMTSTGTSLRGVSFATSYFDSTWIRGLPAQPNRNNRESNAYQTIMNSLGQNPSTHFDHKVTPILRSVVFGGATLGNGSRRPDVAFDVVTSDIARGRDHGLLTYRDMRVKLGWRDIQQMEDITLQLERVNILKSIYGDDVNNIDLMVGLMTEDPLDGALAGPVTTSILQDQFKRTRDADRCWYENQFQGQLLTIFRNTKLKHVVDRNFNTPANPFASEVVQGVRPARTPQPVIPVQLASPGGTGAVAGSTTLPVSSPTGVAIPIGTAVPVTTVPTNTVSTFSHLSTGPHGVFNPVQTLQQLNEEKRINGEDDGEEHKTKYHHHDGDQKIPYDPERRHGNQYVMDSARDSEAFAEDPQGHASTRYRNGQSRHDNGRGTRPAQQFDDIIGWECSGETCAAVALESDPVLTDDPEVMEFIRNYREKKRIAQQNDDTTAVLTAADVGLFAGVDGLNFDRQTAASLPDDLAIRAAALTATSSAFIRENGFNAMLFSHDNNMSTLAASPSPSSRHFSTMQASTTPASSSSSFTQHLRLNNGRNALSPMNGILQTDQRVRLPSTVSAAQTAENIFLVPACRSRV